MFEVQKQTNNPMTIIRAASSYELSEYEKNKLSSVEEGAQKNKIEAIRVNGKKLQIDPEKKEVCFELGNLANKNKITPDDVSLDEYFFIKCELDETALKKVSEWID